MLANFSPELQEQTLATFVNNSEGLVDEYDNLISYWLDGDMDRMLEVEDEELNGYEKYMIEINDARNIEMVNQIQQILEEDNGQTYMVIVGTMHFIMEPSIISLLEEKGYEVVHVY